MNFANLEVPVGVNCSVDASVMKFLFSLWRAMVWIVDIKGLAWVGCGFSGLLIHSDHLDTHSLFLCLVVLSLLI